jgi:hypothetical protein
MNQTTLVRTGLSALLAAMLTACGSWPHTSAPLPPEKFEVLGPVKGQACGSLGFLGTITNFIPMALRSRHERAYQDALAKAPGATSLINVEISEDWAWAVFVSVKCVNVSGTAIKEQVK